MVKTCLASQWLSQGKAVTCILYFDRTLKKVNLIASDRSRCEVMHALPTETDHAAKSCMRCPLRRPLNLHKLRFVVTELLLVKAFNVCTSRDAQEQNVSYTSREALIT